MTASFQNVVRSKLKFKSTSGIAKSNKVTSESVPFMIVAKPTPCERRCSEVTKHRHSLKLHDREAKTYREKTNELNKSLAKMYEHFDVPKVSKGVHINSVQACTSVAALTCSIGLQIVVYSLLAGRQLKDSKRLRRSLSATCLRLCFDACALVALSLASRLSTAIERCQAAAERQHCCRLCAQRAKARWMMR